MKKYLSGLLAGILISTTIVSFAQPIEIKAYINEGFSFIFEGEEKELPIGYKSLVYEGRSYVPARFIGENLGAEVEFDAQSKQISFISKNKDNIDSMALKYENEIKELNDEINSLKEKIENLNAQNKVDYRYSKLPLTQKIDDFEIGIQSFNFDRLSNYSTLNLNLENNNSNTPFKISPLDTKIIIDEEEYSPSDGLTDLNLFNYLYSGDEINGKIEFTNLPKEFEKMQIIFKVEYSDGFNEKSEFMSFYIVND